jgi:hypothetical protein
MEQKLRCEAIYKVREWCLANGFDDGNRRTTFDKDIPFGIMRIEVIPDNRYESIRFEFGAFTCDGQWASMALSEPLSKVLEFKDTIGVDYFMRVPLQRMWNEYFDKVLFKKGNKDEAVHECRADRQAD